MSDTLTSLLMQEQARSARAEARLAEAERRSNIWQYAWQWDVDVRSCDGGYYAIRQWPDEDDIRGPVRSSVDEAIEGIMGMDSGPADSVAGFPMVENPTMKPGTMEFRTAENERALFQWYSDLKRATDSAPAACPCGDSGCDGEASYSAEPVRKVCVCGAAYYGVRLTRCVCGTASTVAEVQK